MVHRDILEIVWRYARALETHGVTVPFVVVFGSQATGRTHEWSDIDLLVVSPIFDRPRRLKDALLLWEVAADIDSRIEPIACGEKQWTDDDSSAIIEIARREGECVEATTQTQVAGNSHKKAR
jgi:predicted nucleotidyltransferase